MLLSEQTGTKETRGSCTVFYSDVASEGGRWCFFSILPPAWPVKWCLLLQYRRVEISSERAFLLCSTPTFFHENFQHFFNIFSIILYTGMFHNRNRRKILFLLQKGFHCNCEAQRTSLESMCEDSGT